MKRHTFVPVLFVGLAIIAAACGDDTNDNPTPPDVGTAGTKSTAGAPGNGGSDGSPEGGRESDGGSQNSVGGGGAGAGPVNSGGAGAGPGPVEECPLPELGEDGCFNCPSEPGEFLNRCVDSDCVNFDNADRLPLLEADGSLPDLPN